MVTNIEKIQFKIERLKNIQNNLKFGLTSRLILYFALIIFLITIVSGMIIYYEEFNLKLIIFCLGFIIYGIITTYFYKCEIKPRENKLKEIAKEIEKYYDQLLK